MYRNTIIFYVLVVWFIFVGVTSYLKLVKTTIPMHSENFSINPTTYKISPSQKLVAFSIPNNKEVSDAVSIVIFDYQKNIFKAIHNTAFPSWDMESDFQWVGDKYLFYMSYCGTACRGLVLLDTSTGVADKTNISYPPFPGEKEKTYIRDWTGNRFEIAGLVTNIYTETRHGVDYMVFTLENYQREYIGEKIMIFANNALIPI